MNPVGNTNGAKMEPPGLEAKITDRDIKK